MKHYFTKALQVLPAVHAAPSEKMPQKHTSEHKSIFLNQ